jgi:hypothetical protein
VEHSTIQLRDASAAAGPSSRLNFVEPVDPFTRVLDSRSARIRPVRAMPQPRSLSEMLGPETAQRPRRAAEAAAVQASHEQPVVTAPARPLATVRPVAFDSGTIERPHATTGPLATPETRALPRVPRLETLRPLGHDRLSLIAPRDLTDVLSDQHTGRGTDWLDITRTRDLTHGPRR